MFDSVRLNPIHSIPLRWSIAALLLFALFVAGRFAGAELTLAEIAEPHQQSLLDDTFWMLKYELESAAASDPLKIAASPITDADQADRSNQSQVSNWFVRWERFISVGTGFEESESTPVAASRPTPPARSALEPPNAQTLFAQHALLLI